MTAKQKRIPPRDQKRSKLTDCLHLAVASYLLSLIVAWPTAAYAQGDKSASESGPVPRIAIGEVSANPGNSLMIPMYFTPDPNTPLRSFVAEIEFVSNNLKFQKAEKGTVLEDRGGTVESGVSEGTVDAKGVTRSKARVTVSLPGKQIQKGLPEGLVVYLVFQVSMQAKSFAIKLNTSVVSAQDIQDRKVAKVNAKSGIVSVELADTNPEAACFFFSH